MKKHFLFVLFCFITALVSAQKLEADGYTAIISNVKKEEAVYTYYGKKYESTEFKGNYVIKKGGTTIASSTFSTMQLSENSININIKTEEGFGNTLTYDFDSKKMEFAGEEYKPKKNKGTEELILSALLIYARYSEE